MLAVTGEICLLVNVALQISYLQVRIALSLQNLLQCPQSSNVLAVHLEGGVMKATNQHFKHSSSLLHSLQTGSRGRGQVNVPHLHLNTRHCQAYSAQAKSASQFDWYTLAGSNTEEVDFVFWRGCFLCKQLGRAQFSFYIFSLTYFVLCISFCVTARFACFGQKGSDWRNRNPHRAPTMAEICRGSCGTGSKQWEGVYIQETPQFSSVTLPCSIG